MEEQFRANVNLIKTLQAVLGPPVEDCLKKIDEHLNTVFTNLDFFEKEIMLRAKSLKEKQPKGRQRKDEILERPEVILEENEDGEDLQAISQTNGLTLTNVSSEPFVNVKIEELSYDSTMSTTTTSRPKRAATGAALEKIKYQKEISNKTKLRRPSNFNQNDCVTYNVYNQTSTMESTTVQADIVPHSKRRKGSTNTTVTSSHFFGDLVHSSSPLQKQQEINNKFSTEAQKKIVSPSTLNAVGQMSCLKNSTEDETIVRVSRHATLVMEVDEQVSVRTRTRQARKQTEDGESSKVNDKTITVTKKKKKRATNDETDNGRVPDNDNEIKSDGQDEERSTEGEENETIGKAKKTRRKKAKKDSATHSRMDTSPSEEGGVRTRTRVQKKPVNKFEDLPVISTEQSSLATIEAQKKPGNKGEENIPATSSAPFSSSSKTIGEKIAEKVNLFENHVDQNESECRVTRTRTKKMNMSDEEKNKPTGDPFFKVPLAVKPLKDTNKKAVLKKVDKTKDPVIDAKLLAIDEKKRLREERTQRAAAAREQAEKERLEQVLRVEKEKEEKLRLKKERDAKLKEEQEKKRLLAVQKKQAEIDTQKRENEAAKMARVQEILEQEERKAAQRKKDQEMQERKIQQAKLAEKLKAAQPTKAIPKKDPPVEIPPPQEMNYVISDDPSSSDEEGNESSKHPQKQIPTWAKPDVRLPHLKDQIYVYPYLTKFFENPNDKCPSLIELFGKENVKLRPRTSSAVWNRTIMDEESQS